MKCAILLIPGAVLLAGTTTTLLTDGAGRKVSVPHHASRIVSLAPSVTEILFAIGAGGQIAGVTDFCTYPAEASLLPKVGGLINPDLERIVSLRPDLAIATTSGNYLDDAERIERLGIPVFTIHTPDIPSILESIRRVGVLAGQTEPADRLAADLSSRLSRTRERAAGRSRPSVLFVIEPSPLIVPGPGSFMTEAIEAAGGRPAVPAGSPRWAQLDMEQVLSIAPEVILVTEPHRAWAEGLVRQAEWARVPAVRSGRVRVVTDAIQHPGPRLFDGIEEVETLLTTLMK